MVVEARNRCIFVLVLLAVSAAATLGPRLYAWETDPREVVRVDLSWVTDPEMLTENILHSAGANLALAAFATSPNGKECYKWLHSYLDPHNVERNHIPLSVISEVKELALQWFFYYLGQQYPRHGMQILQFAYETSNTGLIHYLTTAGVKCSASARDIYASLKPRPGNQLPLMDTDGRPVAAGLREPSSDNDPSWHVELYQHSHDNGSARKIDVSYLRDIGTWSTEVDFEANRQIIGLLIVLVEHGFQLVTKMRVLDQVIAEHPLELDIAQAVDLDPAWQLKLLGLFARRGARMANVLETLIMYRAGRIDSALYLMKKYHMRPSFDPSYITSLINMGGPDRSRRILRTKLVLRYGGYTAKPLPNRKTPGQMAKEIGGVELENVFKEYDGYAANAAAMYDAYVDHH